GGNARRTLDWRAWHNLEERKPGSGQTQISHRSEKPDRHQPRGRRSDLRSDEGGGEVFLRWRSHQPRVETTCAEETRAITTEVNMSETKHINSPLPYASNGDFQRIFHEDMNGLYLLSFLLTADHEKAEQCFVSGLEDAVNGNRVFKEWARSWARREIIKNAVKVINPRPVEGSAHSSPISVNSNGKTLPAERQVEITAVLGLETFERFFFLMSVLTG